ncbi:hypothetical protein LINGRAHAP2_LOCUS4973, partial [Linum grandiflorum]
RSPLGHLGQVEGGFASLVLTAAVAARSGWEGEGKPAPLETGGGGGHDGSRRERGASEAPTAPREKEVAADDATLGVRERGERRRRRREGGRRSGVRREVYDEFRGVDDAVRTLSTRGDSGGLVCFRDVPRLLEPRRNLGFLAGVSPAAGASPK